MGLFDMIKKLHPDSVLIGFLNGPHGIYTNNFMEITADYMGLFRNTGGFDMIRKSIPLPIFGIFSVHRFTVGRNLWYQR